MNIEKYIEFLYYYMLQIIYKHDNYLQNKQLYTNNKFITNTTYKSKQKTYVKTTEQKVNALVSLSILHNLKAVFFTLTLPSRFHPNRILKNGIIINNKNYEFIDIQFAIEDGYQTLKNVYRIFYKRAKNISKNIYFIKIIEPHKSLIPHMHVLFFIEQDKMKSIKNLFYKVSKENNLQRVDFDESICRENIKNVSAYVMKYVLKTFNSKDEFFNIWIEGWRKKHKIRACEMSNLSMSIEIYKTIYYNLPVEEKEAIQKEIEEKNESFFKYFIDNSEIYQIILKEKI